MSLRRLGTIIALVLFGCVSFINNASAKEGYKVSLRIQDSTGTPILKTSLFKSSDFPDSTLKTATLTLLRWEEDTLIGTATLSKKGEFIFSGKEPLAPGEYLIKWNKQPVEFFVSDSNSYINEKLLLQGKKIIQIKGNEENEHFARFQTLINGGSKQFTSFTSFRDHIDSTSDWISLIPEMQNTLLALFLETRREYLMFDWNQPISVYAKCLNDYRIKNTSFGKEELENFLGEFFVSMPGEYSMICIDRLIKQLNSESAAFIAYKIFKYYQESPIMGYEEYACKIYEKYFKSNALKIDDGPMFEMRTFYLLNKSSLIGMKAPELNMEDTYGKMQSLQEWTKIRRYTILYFYTDDCITCKIETPKLIEFVNRYGTYEVDNPITVYAVYTDNNKEKWLKYIDEKLQLHKYSHVHWINVWDPEIKTGFHLLYNVVSTPQMFLIGKDGKIIGRRLNTNALEELIGKLNEIRKKYKNNIQQ